MGHIQDSGFGGTRGMSPSPYRLLGIPLPGPGSPGGQFPSPDWGCIQFGVGGSRHPIQPPLAPLWVLGHKQGAAAGGEVAGNW